MAAEELAEDECDKCGDIKWPVICWQCGGDGFSYHDCGEDVCCCVRPEDNVWCDICGGKGHFPVCPTCHPDADFE